MKGRNKILVGLGWKALKSRTFRNSDDFFDEFVDTLASLGGVYAKFLQGALLGAISSRNKGDVTKQLAVFEDNPVPDYDPTDMLDRILGPRARELDIPDTVPLGVGSYSAVYKAVHRASGKTVAVKILRPGVKQELEKDLRFMKKLAYVMSFGAPGRIPIDLSSLYSSFSKACKKEMDFVSEVEFAQELRRQYADHPVIYIPEMYKDYCNESVIVQEYIEGISAKDIIEAKLSGEDPVEIVRILTGDELPTLMESVLYEAQVALMNKRPFHGDLHPGNLRFIGSGKVALIDFGIRAEPFSDNIVPAYVNILNSNVKIFEGDFDLVRIVDAHFRYMMYTLHKSIESLYVSARKDMQDFYKGLIAGLGVSVDNVSEERRKEWAEKGSPLTILGDLVTNFGDYGLTGRVNEQSPQRAVHTINGLNIALGLPLHKAVYTSASKRSVEITMAQRPELFGPTTILLPDLALENIYSWLEKVTSSNPELALKIRELLAKSKVVEEQEQLAV